MWFIASTRRNKCCSKSLCLDCWGWIEGCVLSYPQGTTFFYELIHHLHLPFLMIIYLWRKFLWFSCFCICLWWWEWILPSGFHYWYAIYLVIQKALEHTYCNCPFLQCRVLCLNSVIVETGIWLILVNLCSHGWKVKLLCTYCSGSNWCNSSFTYWTLFWAFFEAPSGNFSFCWMYQHFNSIIIQQNFEFPFLQGFWNLSVSWILLTYSNNFWYDFLSFILCFLLREVINLLGNIHWYKFLDLAWLADWDNSDVLYFYKFLMFCLAIDFWWNFHTHIQTPTHAQIYETPLRVYSPWGDSGQHILCFCILVWIVFSCLALTEFMKLYIKINSSFQFLT